MRRIESDPDGTSAALMEVVEQAARTVFQLLHFASAEFVDQLGADPVRNLPNAANQLEASCRHELSTNETFSGIGFVSAPEIAFDNAHSLLWWIRQGQEIRGKKHVLNPASDSYYDYNTSEWFGTVRSTVQPFISAPYVDSWGTDRLTITAAVPVMMPSGFVGVIAADLDPARYLEPVERILLECDDMALVDAEGRVILSSIPVLATGVSLERYRKRTGLTAGAAITGSLTRWRAIYLS